MPQMPCHVLAFALGFTVVFLGAGIAVQAEPSQYAVPMIDRSVASEPSGFDPWWLKDAADQT